MVPGRLKGAFWDMKRQRALIICIISIGNSKFRGLFVLALRMGLGYGHMLRGQSRYYQDIDMVGTMSPKSIGMSLQKNQASFEKGSRVAEEVT